MGTVYSLDQRPGFNIALDGHETIIRDYPQIPSNDSGIPAAGILLYSNPTNAGGILGDNWFGAHELVIRAPGGDTAVSDAVSHSACIEYIFVGGLHRTQMRAVKYPFEMPGLQAKIVASILGSVAIALLITAGLLWLKGRGRSERLERRRRLGKQIFPWLSV